MSQYLTAIGPNNLSRSDLPNLLAEIKIGCPTKVDRSFGNRDRALGIACESGSKSHRQLRSLDVADGKALRPSVRCARHKYHETCFQTCNSEVSLAPGVSRQDDSRVKTASHRNSHLLLTGKISRKCGRQHGAKFFVVWLRSEGSLFLPLTWFEVRVLAVQMGAFKSP